MAALVVGLEGIHQSFELSPSDLVMVPKTPKGDARIPPVVVEGFGLTLSRTPPGPADTVNSWHSVNPPVLPQLPSR